MRPLVRPRHVELRPAPGPQRRRYDAVEKTLYLRPSLTGDFRCFLSTAGGYGTVGVKNGKPFVEVKSGTIDVKAIKNS